MQLPPHQHASPGLARLGWRLALCTVTLVLSACGDVHETGWQGYVEADFVRVASPYAGVLEKLEVKRGQQVISGAPLFALERSAETAILAQARARASAADARRDNLAAGQRAPQREVSHAQLDAARAALALSSHQFRQQQALRRSGYIAQAQLDEARATLDRDSARLREAEAQTRAATQSFGREAELAAAQADVEAARAQVSEAEWQLAQKSRQAALAARIQDTYFVPGEWVPAGVPVVSLLAPGHIKVRFYVAESDLPAIKPGTRVSVRCDGCKSAVAATISFVSPQAEYTPPVLYSKDARAKLRFLVEARPADASAETLLPGQPVDIIPAP